jgi:hypothetical protein
VVTVEEACVSRKCTGFLFGRHEVKRYFLAPAASSSGVAFQILTADASMATRR